MPVARYFLFVGGVLLALLFVFDAYAPKLPVADRTEAAAIDLPVIRIHSERKWPERVVFDTNVPTIVPAVVAEATAKTDAAPAPAIAADVPATRRVRDAFAQLEPAQLEPAQLAPASLKRPQPKQRVKRKIVKNRINPPMVVVAQQPRFGFFANNAFFVNNTW